MAEQHSGFRLLGNISGVGVYKCEGMIDPISNQDYVTKNYSDTGAGISGMYLMLSGANANQTINIGNQIISGSGIISSGTISGGNIFCRNISGATISGENIAISNRAILGNNTSNIHGININAQTNQMLTANYSNSTNNASSYFLKGTQTASGNTTTNKNTYGYYLNQDISGTDTNNFGSSVAYGMYLDVDDTSTINYINATHDNYGIVSDLNFGGTNTINTNLRNFAGYFICGGNLGISGATTHTGVYTSANGTADNNYGIFLISAGATNNYSIYVSSGNVFLGNDNIKTYFGTARDCSIYYDAVNMVINPKDVGTGYLKISGALVCINNISGATIKAANGFTGTGAYTNFTISGGIILAAS